MALNDSICKPKKDRDNEPDPDVLAHIQSLGLATVADYVSWCARHGFSRRVEKHWRLRLKERDFVHRVKADARLCQKKLEKRRPDKIIQRIFDDNMQEDDVTDPGLKAVCRACKAANESHDIRKAFRELLQRASEYSGLVSGQYAIEQFGHQAGNTFIDGLLALSRYAHHWIRPLRQWQPKTHNTRKQFSSLTRHLLAQWPMPAFMDSAWFTGAGAEATVEQSWFLHVGRGENIRTADLPIPYTKRMAHHFMQAPADMSITSALRYGQVLGLGGCERLARAIVATMLGSRFSHDEFWTTVIVFFIANPMLDPAQVGPMVDFIEHQRFATSEVFTSPGVLERLPPPQPNFTMKGRTPDSIMRQMESWHRRLAKTVQPKADWPQCGIAQFEFIEGAERGGTLKIWTITELLSTKALVDEGRKMKHCVGSYARTCAVGASSIWTLEVETFEGRSKMLTVEVNLVTKQIVQARGKCNMMPGEKHRNIMRRWAEQAGLSLARHV